MMNILLINNDFNITFQNYIIEKCKLLYYYY